MARLPQSQAVPGWPGGAPAAGRRGGPRNRFITSSGSPRRPRNRARRGGVPFLNGAGGHYVTFDRPYLLVVSAKATGEPLFLAEVANPVSS